MTVAQLLERLWADYVAMTPQAERIHALLAARGEAIANDHVALRGLGIANLGIAALAKPFEAVGYVEQPARYRFDDKKLVARYWKHPEPGVPKVFISELCVGELSATAQQVLAALVAQLPAGFSDRADLPWAGRPWRITRAVYTALLAESEYAAWLAAFGFRVNHFTVAVDALTTFGSLAALNKFLVGSGFVLNTAGGAIKGSPAAKLEQSSTRADAISVDFDGERAMVPSVYYEFAKRYDGFEGFVPESADKIFESTNSAR
ncbi:MAG TPA: DUF1338 domain-containing protein [Kofleriaceae bacterium]|jgi:hypothetical protein